MSLVSYLLIASRPCFFFLPLLLIPYVFFFLRIIFVLFCFCSVIFSLFGFSFALFVSHVLNFLFFFPSIPFRNLLFCTFRSLYPYTCFFLPLLSFPNVFARLFSYHCIEENLSSKTFVSYSFSSIFYSRLVIVISTFQFLYKIHESS